MNNWYDRINCNTSQAPTQQSFAPVFFNPVQKAQYIMQALTNPAAFAKQQFPDIPDNIVNDPNQVLRYIQQSRGISDNQLSQIVNQYPRRY